MSEAKTMLELADDLATMTPLEKRIECLQLLGKLRQGDEKPGNVILRALRALQQLPEVERVRDEWCEEYTTLRAAAPSVPVEVIRLLNKISNLAYTADGKEWRLSENEIVRALNAQPIVPIPHVPAQAPLAAQPTGLYRGFEVRCPHCESWFEPEDFEDVPAQPQTPREETVNKAADALLEHFCPGIRTTDIDIDWYRQVARVALSAAPVSTSSEERVQGASDIIDEAACLIWSELCPGLVMGDDDRAHYENAAKAVLALSRPDRGGGQ